MNADRRYSHCAKYTHPLKEENLSKKTRSYGLVLQRKGDEEKRALPPELGNFQLAADGGNSKPVWGTLP
jgi:hypothetical protein